MKNINKTAIFAILGLILLPSISFASIDVDLKYGAKGQEVTELQEFLISKGLLTSQATGNFYSLTQNAAVAYQASVGLPTTGFVGPLTRGKINNELSTITDVANQAQVQETGTVSAPVSTDSNSVLQGQINDLLKQVQALIAQQNVQSSAVAQTNQTLAQIAQNTTPTQIVLGGDPATPVDQSALTVTSTLGSADISQPFRSFIFTVTLISSNGKPNSSSFVTMNAPDNSDDTNQRKLTDNNGKVTFVYFPSTSGSKIVTFSSGGLSMSSTVNVIEDPTITDYYTKYNTTVSQINDLLTQLANVPATVNASAVGRGITTDGITSTIKSEQGDITKQINTIQTQQTQLISEFNSKEK